MSVKVAYFAEAAGGGPRAAHRVRSHPKVESSAGAAAPAGRAAGERAVGRRAVRAGAGRFRAAAQDAAQRRCVPCWATPPPRCSSAAGVAPTARRRGARARRLGRGGPQHGGRRMRLARGRATAYPKLNLSLRVLGARDPTASTTSSRWWCRSASPTTSIEVFAVPAPGGVQVEVSGVEVGERRAVGPPQPRVHRGREADGARGPLRSRRATRAAQAHPGRRGLGGGSADAAAALLAVRRLLDVDIDDAGVLDDRRRGRLRRAVLRARRRGVDAGPRRGHRAGAGAAPGWRSWSRSRRSGCRRPTVYQAWDELGGPRSARVVPAPRRLDPSSPSSCNDLEPAAEALEPRLVEFRNALEAATGRAGAARRERVGLRGADRRRPRPPGARRRRCGRRLRVPVVGTDERHPRRPPRPAGHVPGSNRRHDRRSPSSC